jgi:transposase
MHAWSDNDGDLAQAIRRDRLLANISLYWSTGAIGSSWPYYGQHHDQDPLPPGRTRDVPLGYAAFSREVRRRPRRKPREVFADRGYDHDKYRQLLSARGITPRIARRGVAHGFGLGPRRWVAERGVAWLHSYKQLRTR